MDACRKGLGCSEGPGLPNLRAIPNEQCLLQGLQFSFYGLGFRVISQGIVQIALLKPSDAGGRLNMAP